MTNDAVGSGREHLIQALYDAHHRRDIEQALSLLTDDVSWPDVAGGRTLHGHEQARRYWTDQFATIEPDVTPLEIVVTGDTARVRVHQVVHDKSGNLLHEGTVVHVFTFDADRVSAMRVESAHSPDGT